MYSSRCKKASEAATSPTIPTPPLCKGSGAERKLAAGVHVRELVFFVDAGGLLAQDEKT